MASQDGHGVGLRQGQQQQANARPMTAQSGQGKGRVRTAEAVPGPRRSRKRARDEASLPEEIQKNLPQSATLKRMKDLERRVDSAIAGRLAEARQTVAPWLQESERTLRIYVFNTFTPSQGDSEPAYWTLHVHGRVLGQEQDGEAKFTNYLKRAKISVDSGNAALVTWEKERAEAASDGLEVKRQGSRPMEADIELEIQRGAERYELSDALANLLGVKVATRPSAIVLLWHYIKQRGLQSADDPSTINCDESLKAIFKKPSLSLSSASSKLAMHLRKADPIRLHHRVETSGQGPFCRECVDVKVDPPVDPHKLGDSSIARLALKWESDDNDERLPELCRAVREHARRRDFFESFAQSPGEFLNAAIASQAADLRTLSANSHPSALERWSGFYSLPWADDAAARYLHQRRRAGC